MRERERDKAEKAIQYLQDLLKEHLEGAVIHISDESVSLDGEDSTILVDEGTGRQVVDNILPS